ncbi:MAG: hypothetical protein IRZ16_04075 [Myxococcaceae bacterium]|nr:hypothetical protein [Myxococcaceae bacterium]
METSTDRRAFLGRFRNALNSGEYALLKHVVGSLEQGEQGSDVDVLVPRERVPELIQFVKSDEAVARVRVVALSYMSTLKVFFRDGGFLMIDFIHRFIRKSLIYLDARDLLRSADGAFERTPSVDRAFEYPFLFSLLNGADLPEKYRRHVLGLSPEDQRLVLSRINERYGLSASHVSELFLFDEARRRRVIAAILRRPENRPTQRVFRLGSYALDVLTRARRENRGIVVTFYGADGSGKSTILEDVARELRERYRKRVVILRHRPGLLPILSAFIHGKAEAEARSMARLPRTGKNRSRLSSLARFAYYFSDYAVGQWVVFAKHSLRGDIVLYDRYFLDFVVDAKRSNIRLSPRFVSAFGSLLATPAFNFLLYAPPDVVRQRKQELAIEDIEELTAGYRREFERLKARKPDCVFMAVENLDRSQTVARIMGTLVEAL